MKLSAPLVAAATVLVTMPVTAYAAGELFMDQMVSWIAAAIASALMGLIGAAFTKLTKAHLDAKASATLQTALENAAKLGATWVIATAMDTDIGKRIKAAVGSIMLPYAENGAPGALTRFGMDKAETVARSHLQDMAEAKLIENLQKTAPDLLRDALIKAGAPA